MNNIFLSHRGTRSTIEKVFGWLIAFAMILQSSAALPLIAYAESEVSDATTSTEGGSVSTPSASNNTSGEGNGSSENSEQPVDNSQSVSSTNGVDNSSQGQSESEGVLTNLLIAMNSTLNSSEEEVEEQEPSSLRTSNLGGHKVDICHIPKGNPENMQTIEVDNSSVSYQAHIGHGDTIGACAVPPQPPTQMTCENVTGEGWYGQYFNYSRTHDEMNLPSSSWGAGHADPLGALWTSDWYDSTHYRFDRIDANLMFGEDFYPFDATAEEIDNGHDYHFGVHWSAYANVAVAGAYTLSLTSDDDSWVYVDGVLALDNSGLHSPTTKSATLNLTGKNKVDVYFAERHVNRSHMSLSFVTPGVKVTPVKAGCKEKINLVATKIVCDEEAMLPNWGLGGADITSTTAADYVASHKGCRLAADWKFQWGYSGVKDLLGSHVGEADGSTGAGSYTGATSADWKTFGPTNNSGAATVLIEELASSDKIWVREVLKDGYVPFTFYPGNATNTNNKSAELYCGSDVLNYDNYDYVSQPVGGNTYYCVAFNALKELPPPPPPVCELDIVSDSTNIITGAGAATTTYAANPRWTALIPGATWIWETFLVETPTLDETTTFSKTFTLAALPTSASLVVAADNSYTVSINSTVVGTDTTEFNYFESGKDTYVATPYLVVGANTITFTVKNWAQAGGTPQSNPAGLLYKLHIELPGLTCVPPPPPANTPPVITVVGTNPATIYQSSTYIDQSATVVDAEDGNVTNKLVTTGSVNTAVLGTYTITYNATDSQSLAAATKTRTVNVIPVKACAAPIDVMLVIDKSGSMNDDQENPEQPLTQAKDAAKAFINTLATSSDLVGVVSYSTAATLNSALSGNFTAVKASFTSITAAGSTNIGAGIERAQQEIALNGRLNKKHIIVLLSDGLPTVPTPDPVAHAKAKATAAKSAGTIIYTIGLGSEADATLMSELASQPANYFSAPTGAQLEGIYAAISSIECDRLPSSVTGKKINDRNANGIVDQNESGLSGWAITLSTVGGGLTLSATTTADGTYKFPDVMAGNYMLCEVAKSGWNQTFPTTNNGCYLLNIAPNAKIVDKHFLNTESIKPECRDGKDNDGDGKVDFAGGDLGCDTENDDSENQKPVITVTAPNPMIVTLGTPFVDTGAIALDTEDGNITANIVKAESVNTLVVGTYYVSYSVVDSKGLAADPKQRQVKVVTACTDGKDNDGDGKIDYPADTGCANPEDNDENNRPVITVLGTNPIDLTIGNVYTDAGATAQDQEDGNITPSIVKTGTVNTAVLGSYTIRYNVSDSKGLAAVEKTRLVRVNPVLTQCNDDKDNDGDGRIDFDGHMAFAPDSGCDSPEDNDENNRPIITVTGTTTMEVSINTTFADLLATVFDAEDGQINNKLVASGVVNTAVLGTYTITYNATDSKSLAAVEKTRIVKVVSSCSDGRDNDGDKLVDYPLDKGCDTPQDDSENEKPVITLLGDVVMNIILGSTYTDQGATAADPEDGNITAKIITVSTVSTAVLGAYTITYNATDSKNIAADTVMRTVNVNQAPCTVNCGGGSTPPACSDGGDNDGDGFADFPRDPGCDSPQDNDERDIGPTLTLLGANPMSINVGTVFADPGATARDPEDGDITSRIVVTGSVNTSTVGAYTLTYNVSDAQGHAATPATRVVNVVTAGCTTNCGGGGGSGPITLSIFNEKLVASGTAVTITWNTNQLADSRVVYGLDSRPTLGTAPLYGYSLTNATDTALVTSHTMTLAGIPTGITTHFRPVSTDGARVAVGIELHREAIASLPNECFYLREYVRFGIVNNPVEVTKLQTFLKNHEGFDSLAITGFFDMTTEVAVRTFQDRYAADVLTPWNLPSNTGYVYYTTQKKVNELYCKRAFPLNTTQLAEIDSFKALIAAISAQRVETSPLPIVGTNDAVGTVAGASTEVVGDTTNPDTASLGSPEYRGRIALADLLATMPNGDDALDATRTDDSGVRITVGQIGEADGAVLGTSTKRGLAAVVQSISDRTSLTANAIYALAIIIIAALLLTALLGRRYVLAKSE